MHQLFVCKFDETKIELQIPNHSTTRTTFDNFVRQEFPNNFTSYMTPRETVERVAELAKLQFNETEIVQFSDQFQNILKYIGEIEKLDLSGVEPLTRFVTSRFGSF